MPDDQYSLADLARLADVTPRTVRYYVAQGLLPSPEAAGPSTRYGEGHLARLRLIRRLQRDHLPLAEIRARLERMGDEEVLAAAAALDPQEPDPSLDRDETLGFVRSLMARAGVRPNVPGVMPGAPPAAAPVPAMPAPPSIPGAPPPSKASGIGPSQLLRRALVLPSDMDPAHQDATAPHSTVAELRIDQGQPATGTAAPRAASPAPARTTWERLAISPDVELHVRRPLDRQTNKRVDQLERIARELFEDP